MVEGVEVVKVQARKSGSLMVTIPKKLAETLEIRGGVHLKAYISVLNGKKVLVYEKVE